VEGVCVVWVTNWCREFGANINGFFQVAFHGSTTDSAYGKQKIQRTCSDTMKKFKTVFYRKKTSIVSLFCCSIHVYIAGNYVARKDNLAHNFSKNLARISD